MAVDDTHAEHLASKASAAAHLTSSSSTSIQSLYTLALSQRTRLEQEQDDKYLALAPTFLSLHQQASSSKQLLSSLESFLSTFQSDLSTLSTHISALQATSHQIDSRLDATRDVEVQLASFLSHIALSPRIVELFFETEPDSRPELWLKAVKQLERVLDATSPSASITLPNGPDAVGTDVKAVQEVRAVAEACKNVVATKLRNYLIAPHSSIKASVTTNLQVLQTSVLLRHHRPLYAFLARQMPRVAIDVQRSYVGSARLYFETAFRRYARSLGVIRKRWTEASSGVEITDLPGAAWNAATAISSLQANMTAVSRIQARIGGNGTPARTAQEADSDSNGDPWLFPANRLQYARLESNAGTVLGYLADESHFKACPENLFRSLSLVLLDNACSEYTFLVRFFEGISDDVEPATSRADERSKASTVGGAVGPDESASVTGADETVDEEAGPEATVVQLGAAEQRRLKGRGASDEIFKQVMEPSVATWVTFSKTLLSVPTSTTTAVVSAATAATGGGGSSGTGMTPGGYFSLLSMLTLNDALLELLTARGCTSSLVESALMGFKITAYPLVKRFLDDQISALSSLSSPSSSSAGVWSLLNRSTSSPTLTSPLADAIVIRYTSLFTTSLYILYDSPDQGILSALARLRSRLAKALTTSKFPDNLQPVRTLISALEAAGTGTLASHPKVQNEFSFWNETLKSMA